MRINTEVWVSPAGVRTPTDTEARAGVSFPSVDGSRSTSATGRAILADAAHAADPDLAERILACRDWRKGYAPLVRELTAASISDSEGATSIARAGLASMRSRLTFADRDHETTLDVALAEVRPAYELGTGAIRGTGRPVRELRVPYRGGELSGRELTEQLDRWVEAGSVEPSFVTAIGRVAENPDWLALPGRSVALVGAGAEIGPLAPLCSWGVEVLALDVPRSGVWKRIGETARAGAGTVHVPLAADGSQGVDLVRDLPEAHAWLQRGGRSGDLTLGMYAYADGGEHVRVTGAFDALATELVSAGHAEAIAYLATPTDAFVVPEEAARWARSAYSDRRLRRVLQAPAKALSGDRLYHPAYADGLPVADALVSQQGPNYALAKRLQRWRGVAAVADGQRVSFNVAPSTLTRSVTKNRILAAAYAGAHHFGIEIFAPETTSTLMAALLVHDLNTAPASRSHPERLFSDGAAHGGLWRAAYEPRSALGIAALAGLPAVLVGRGGRS
ncbi:MAG TPA: hypothetical protein VMB91_05280 [Solirubrobacteraceae bacterium]|nr:hypothetical protein [Solirubrobacteraceae bacterium]